MPDMKTADKEEVERVLHGMTVEMPDEWDGPAMLCSLGWKEGKLVPVEMAVITLDIHPSMAMRRLTEEAPVRRPDLGSADRWAGAILVVETYVLKGDTSDVVDAAIAAKRRGQRINNADVPGRLEARMGYAMLADGLLCSKELIRGEGGAADEDLGFRWMTYPVKDGEDGVQGPLAQGLWDYAQSRAVYG